MVTRFRVSGFCESPAGLNTVYTDKIESDSRRSSILLDGSRSAGGRKIQVTAPCVDAPFSKIL